MQTQNTGIDFIAYDANGSVVLLAEAKSRHGTSEAWAAKFRRNMLAHGALPQSKYFLIATPERMYGWKQENLNFDEVPPDFTIDAHKALAPYFAKFDQDPARITPEAFELLVLTWLTDIARSEEYLRKLDPSLQSLSDSGLLSSLRQAHIEMNPAE
jgi:hypothetical protein